MPHITDPVPGETIEVSDGGICWYRSTVIGTCSDSIVIEMQGDRGLTKLSQWAFSRRPPKKTLKPWTAETFAPFWNHQFKESAWGDFCGCTPTGWNSHEIELQKRPVSFAELHRNWLHRPSPSQPWQPCGEEVES